MENYIHSNKILGANLLKYNYGGAMTMNDFIAQYENPVLKNINLGLINRDYDDNLVEHILRVFRTLNENEYIDFIGYEYTDDAREIDLDYYENNRRTKKGGKNAKKQPIYKNMHDSLYGELRAKFKLRIKGEEMIKTVKYLLPLTDEFGYYKIKGKRFFQIFQLVESSTYAKGQSVILKSLMPLVVSRKQREIKDTDGNMYTVYSYAIHIFTRITELFYFYFAKVGVTKALEYFSLDKVVKFVQEEGDKDKYLYFGIHSELFLEVEKELFNKFDYLQNSVASILSVTTNRLQFENLDNTDFWVERLGALTAQKAFAYTEKGKSSLVMFERMLDEGTKRILKVHDFNKDNTFAIVRWMVQNFLSLRKKDDVDLRHKRVRSNEVIANFLTLEYSKRINRVLSISEKDLTLDQLQDIFAVPGDVIISKLFKSGLLRFDDRVNDMDFISKLRYTLKGPSSIGSKNARSMSVKYRSPHASHIGRLDLNVRGTSDPGSSGMLTPFIKTDGLYFEEGMEFEDGIFDLEKELYEYNDRLDDTRKLVLDYMNDCYTPEQLLERKQAIADINNSIKMTVNVNKENKVPDTEK